MRIFFKQKQTIAALQPRTTGVVRLCKSALAAAALALVHGGVALAQQSVRVGIIADQSSVYSASTGKGSVIGAQMAIEDFGGQVLGRKIELLTFDHQSKADPAAAKAREWYDNGVDAIHDVGGSAAGLAVLNIAKEKDKILVLSGPASDRFTGAQCAPTVAHWAYNSWALANVVGRAAAEKLGKNWFFITADYSGGHDVANAAGEALRSVGGKVVGEARHPINAPDLSSAVVQAQASGADVIGLANFINDSINTIKTARAFGIASGGKQKIVGLLTYLTDVHALGLKYAQGMLLSEAFYWDMNEETRAFAKRFYEKAGFMPNMSQMGVYSSVTHWLKAVDAVKSTDAQAVMAKMREMPVRDAFTQSGTLRADGMMVHDMYLFQVKTPAESQYPWDYYHLISTVPAQQAFLPLEQSPCPLVRQGDKG